MLRDDSAFLLDILIAAREIRSFTEGMSYSDFVRNREKQLVVVKLVEIVGEAAARVGDATRQAHPNVPWKNMIGMRNRLVHAYFEVDLALVWDVARRRIVDLVTYLESVVPERD